MLTSECVVMFWCDSYMRALQWWECHVRCCRNLSPAVLPKPITCGAAETSRAVLPKHHVRCCRNLSRAVLPKPITYDVAETYHV